MINSHPVKTPRAIFKQLDLFAMMPTGRDTNASTLEFWDLAPLWFGQQPKGNPPQFQRRFKDPDTRQWYIADIRPAHLLEGRTEKRLYPGQREMVIYETLQMLAANGAGGVAQDLMHITCTFTLGGLRKTLIKYGHEYTTRDIRQALDILRNTSVTMRVLNDDGDGGFGQSNYMPWLAGQSHSDWQNATPKTILQMAFHPLVAMAIRQGKFRAYDFETSMRMPNGAARYLYRRLIARYRHAPKPPHLTDDSTYHFGILDIARDSGFYDIGLDSDDEKVRKQAEKHAIRRWREVVTAIGPKKDRKRTVREKKRPDNVPWLVMNVKYHEAAANRPAMLEFHPSPLLAEQIIEANAHTQRLALEKVDSRQIKLPIS